MVLLVGAGLLGKSFYRLLEVDLGFEPDRLATLAVAAPPSAVRERPSRAVALGRRDRGPRRERCPAWKRSASRACCRSRFNGNTDWIRFVGRPYNGEHTEVNQRDVSADYFTTLGARLLRGRYFTDAEDASKPRVVVINRTLARRYFPDEDPIGKTFGDTSLSPGSIKEIIGIVDDIREGPLDSEIWPAVYYPYNQDPDTVLLAGRPHHAGRGVGAAGAARRHPRDRPRPRHLPAKRRCGRGSTTRPSAYLRRSSAWLIGGFAGRGPAARRGRPLRRDRVLGGPESSRDRRAHGARRAARLRVSARPEGGGVARRRSASPWAWPCRGGCRPR